MVVYRRDGDPLVHPRRPRLHQILGETPRGFGPARSRRQATARATDAPNRRGSCSIGHRNSRPAGSVAPLLHISRRWVGRRAVKIQASPSMPIRCCSCYNKSVAFSLWTLRAARFARLFSILPCHPETRPRQGEMHNNAGQAWIERQNSCQVTASAPSNGCQRGESRPALCSLRAQLE